MLFSSACSWENSFNKDYFFELLKPTTHIKLYCFKSNDTIVSLIDNTQSISIFKELINGRTDNLITEKISGKMIFYDHDKKIISVTLTVSGCYYNYGNCKYRARLSYKVGMLLEEACYSNLE